MRKHVFATLIMLASLSSVNAAIIVNVGDHQLQPDLAGQEISIEVTATDEDPKVVGFNLVAQLGDGSGVGSPIFDGMPDSLEAVDFSGGIWDAYTATTSGTAPIGAAPQFAAASVTFNESDISIMPNGVLAKLKVDTTGIFEGEFDLRLAETLGNPSNFILPGGNQEVPVVSNGKVMIAAVPEPSAAALLVASLAVLPFFRRCRNNG